MECWEVTGGSLGERRNVLKTLHIEDMKGVQVFIGRQTCNADVDCGGAGL